MANVQINQLPAGTTPLDGSELIPVDQGATTVKITTSDIAVLANENAVLNAQGTPKITSDIFSNRPLADTAGSIYISTDTDEIYQYNGSNWDLTGGIVQSIISSTLSVDSTDPRNPIVNLGYGVYTAIIMQTGIDDPNIISVLQNTLGFEPTFGYVSPGNYNIISTFAWPNNKIAVFLTPGYMPNSVSLGWERNSSSQIRLYSKKTSDDTYSDNLIINATIEIRIYP
jgi:hypothetical protein